MKKLFLATSFLLLLTSCGNTKETSSEVLTTQESESIDNGNPTITITLSNDKTITCELYEDIAPISVHNFLNLVNANYYDGLVIHRIIPNFMIQSGGYYIQEEINSDGDTIKMIYQKENVPTIFGEFSENGYENSLSHVAGVLSMARATDMNSASSQFFICSADSTSLDGKYAAFGKVVDEESLKNVVEVSLMQTCMVDYTLQNFPINGIYIKSIVENKKDIENIE